MHTSKKIKVESGKLFERIVSLENLLGAWEEFRRGKRNKADVQEFETNLEENLFVLHHELLAEKWRPELYKSFFVTDPKLRHIHKAIVRDRVVHQAVFRVLYPVFDKGFIFDSYSCRLEKGTHRAVKRLETFCRISSKNYRQPVFALKCDVKKFFDSVGHGVLRELIAGKITDSRALSLVDLIIESFSSAPGKGLPLGNVTSQLFANIYLNQLDHFVKHTLKVKCYIRYTDDFVIVNSDINYVENLLPKIQVFLTDRLKLELHPRKIIFRKLSQGIDFLGYVVLPRHIVLRTKTKRRIFRKLSAKSKMLAEGSVSKKDFYHSRQSYLGILKHCSGNTLTVQIKNLSANFSS